MKLLHLVLSVLAVAGCKAKNLRSSLVTMDNKAGNASDGVPAHVPNPTDDTKATLEEAMEKHLAPMLPTMGDGNADWRNSSDANTEKSLQVHSQRNLMATKTVVSTSTNKIHEAGPVISFLVDALWPDNQPSVWEQVEDQVIATVDNAIRWNNLKNELTEVEGRILNVKGLLIDFRVGDEGGALEDAENECMRVNNLNLKLEKDTVEAESQNDVIERCHLMPCSILFAVTHLAVLKERHLCGPFVPHCGCKGKEKTKDTFWLGELKRVANEHKEHFDWMQRCNACMLNDVLTNDFATKRNWKDHGRHGGCWEHALVVKTNWNAKTSTFKAEKHNDAQHETDWNNLRKKHRDKLANEICGRCDLQSFCDAHGRALHLPKPEDRCNCGECRVEGQCKFPEVVGTCGSGKAGNGVCKDGNDGRLCCSQHGWCGGPTWRGVGTCGGGNKGNGICSNGLCCSSTGWCGADVKHCGAKIQAKKAKISKGVGTCGNGKKGNGKCKKAGKCCSPSGWCGITAAHCGKL